MKFLLDMGLPRRTALFLRTQGYDVVHLRDQGLQRLSDSLIIEKARDEERIILTHDLDFGRLIALSRATFPSAITFRLSDMRSETINRYLLETLTHFAAELESGALISINEEGIRVRRLAVKGSD